MDVEERLKARHAGSSTSNRPSDAGFDVRLIEQPQAEERPFFKWDIVHCRPRRSSEGSPLLTEWLFHVTEPSLEESRNSIAWVEPVS